jgi:ParB family chromosome partitioning protein
LGEEKNRSGGLSTAESSRQFQLVAGERRWRAAQAAALERIPAIIREVSDQQALELAVIENVQRHDITPLDAAMAYRRLADEFQLSQERIAQRVGKSRSSIANTLRLLDLPAEVRQALNDGKLSEGHGRAILLAEGEGARRAAFRKILRDKLSVREAEELARNTVEGETLGGHDIVASAKAQKKEALQVEVQHLAEELQKLLGCRIHLKHRQRGGQIVINYYSTDEMNRIVDLLRKTEAE